MATRRTIANVSDIAAEIVRRAVASSQGADGAGRLYVVHLSDPPTASERLKLAAARLMSWPIALMPEPCRTADEWLRRFAPSDRPRRMGLPAA
jgi:hypothetical protein